MPSLSPPCCYVCVCHQGELYDSMNVLDWLMEKDNVLPRLNSRILSTAAKSLDLSENIGEQLTWQGLILAVSALVSLGSLKPFIPACI